MTPFQTLALILHRLKDCPVDYSRSLKDQAWTILDALTGDALPGSLVSKQIVACGIVERTPIYGCIENNTEIRNHLFSRFRECFHGFVIAYPSAGTRDNPLQKIHKILNL